MAKNQDLEKLEAKVANLVKRMWELAAPAKQKHQLTLDSLAEIHELNEELRKAVKQLIDSYPQKPNGTTPIGLSVGINQRGKEDKK